MRSQFLFTEQSTGLQFIVEAPRTMTIDDFHQALQRRVIIKFVKKSTNRVRYLYCTRNPEIIREIGQGDRLPGPDSQGYKGPREVIPVFDLVKNDWRSFDVRTVKDVKQRRLNTLDAIFRRNRYDRDFNRGRSIGSLGQRRDKEVVTGVEDEKFESFVGEEFFAIELGQSDIMNFTHFLKEQHGNNI